MKKFYALLLLFGSQLLALPENPETAHGDAHVFFIDRRIDIDQGSHRAIVDWENFSIGSGETVKISQPAPDSALLNRVKGSLPSSIDGMLEAEGKVYLVNPLGVVIGKEGKIKTGGFIGSTLEIAEQTFLSNENLHFEGASERSIVSRGSIEALSSDVLLLAREVENNGEILAKKGSVILAGASEANFNSEKIYILPDGDGAVLNAGKIKALRAEVRAAGGSVLSLAINHSGIIEAPVVLLQSEKEILQATGQIISKDENTGGSVTLLSEDINLIDECLIDVSGRDSGGKVIIGGDVLGPEADLPLSRTVYVGKDVEIKADAVMRGSGGRVIVWGNDSNYFYGKVSARGGRFHGDGGFVEISSHLGFDYQGTTDATAPMGKMGTLLLDPADITISTAAGTPPLIPIPPPTSTYYYCPPGASATLNNTNLQDALATANIIVSTACGSGPLGTTGDITWSGGAPVTWTAATTLSLIADRAMSLGSDITSSGTGSFTAMNFQAGTTGTGTFVGITVQAGVTITSAEGDITMTGRGGSTGDNNVGIQINAGSTLRSIGTGADAATITLSGTGAGNDDNNFGVDITGVGATVTSVDGNISITGASVTPNVGGANNNNYGISIDTGATVSSTGTGTNAATITLVGTGADTDNTNRGTFLSGASSLVTSVDGNIDVTATGGMGLGNNSGLKMDAAAAITSTGTGANAATITIVGTGDGTDDNNNGVEISGTSTVISSVDGNIDITGTSLVASGGGPERQLRDPGGDRGRHPLHRNGGKCRHDHPRWDRRER